jgi:putative NADPH-quinone reductase
LVRLAEGVPEARVLPGGYTSKKRFEKGRFVGKRAMLSVTVGTSRLPMSMTGAAETLT